MVNNTQVKVFAVYGHLDGKTGEALTLEQQMNEFLTNPDIEIVATESTIDKVILFYIKKK